MVHVYERALPGDSGMALASVTMGLNLCDLEQVTQPAEEQ